MKSQRYNVNVYGDGDKMKKKKKLGLIGRQFVRIESGVA